MIYQKKHPAENIYFIKSGSALKTWKEYDGVPIALFQPGDVFGDFEVYKNTTRLFSVMSITEVELLVLDKTDFKNIFFRLDPSLGNNFVQEMEIRFVYLERVMQMVVDCVFQGKNLFEINQSIINFEKMGSLLKVEDKKNFLLDSFQSKLFF